MVKSLWVPDLACLLSDSSSQLRFLQTAVSCVSNGALSELFGAGCLACLLCVLQLGGHHHLHHLPGSSGVPQWPPAGSMGRSPGMFFMGRSPGTMGTSPFGRSIDMVDMCTQLMEAGGENTSRVGFGWLAAYAAHVLALAWLVVKSWHGTGCAHQPLWGSLEHLHRATWQ